MRMKVMSQVEFFEYMNSMREPVYPNSTALVIHMFELLWVAQKIVKLSSIHSFKGWESHTVFLIIEPHKSDSIQDFESVELIYTAITRAQVNLFILNKGNEKYDSFFNDNIQN